MVLQMSCHWHDNVEQHFGDALLTPVTVQHVTDVEV